MPPDSGNAFLRALTEAATALNLEKGATFGLCDRTAKELWRGNISTNYRYIATKVWDFCCNRFLKLLEADALSEDAVARANTILPKHNEAIDAKKIAFLALAKSIAGPVAERRLVEVPSSPETSGNEHANNSPSIHGQIKELSPLILRPFTMTRKFTGRVIELSRLRQWIQDTSQTAPRVFVLHGLSGDGKSAIAWTWFTQHAPQEMRPLIGRIWWNVSKVLADFDRFLRQAFSYVRRGNDEDIKDLSIFEIEDLLLQVLRNEPYLIIFDGLERYLCTYSHLETMAGADPSAYRVRALYTRHTADERVGAFLKQLAQPDTKSRVLITTSLYPIELQDAIRKPIPYTDRIRIEGLTQVDSLALWSHYFPDDDQALMGQLLPYFDSCGYSPLYIQLFAGDVSSYPNFQAWLKANPNFDPGGLLLAENKAYIFDVFTRGLSDPENSVLNTLSALRVAIKWDALCDLLSGPDKPCADTSTLATSLQELCDRDLVRRREGGSYDLHQAIRSLVWTRLGVARQQAICLSLLEMFSKVTHPTIEQVQTFNDIVLTVEHYYILVRLKRYTEAFQLFKRHLDIATHSRLGLIGMRLQLLREIVPDDPKAPQHLRESRAIIHATHSLALTYHYLGQLNLAIKIYKSNFSNEDWDVDAVPPNTGYSALSSACRLAGRLREAHIYALRSIQKCRDRGDSFLETSGLFETGLLLAVIGEYENATIAQHRALAFFEKLNNRRYQGVVRAFLAQQYIWEGKPELALPEAIFAKEASQEDRVMLSVARAEKLVGCVSLELGESEASERSLDTALKIARDSHFTQEELPTLVALAELRRRSRDCSGARNILSQVWGPALSGPFPLFHSQAFAVLARIEIDEGNTESAIIAANRAFSCAWCDGPPYSFSAGLIQARRLFTTLCDFGANEPELPPFDVQTCEPLPNVVINPRDDLFVKPADCGIRRRTRRSR